jgi:signal peptidase I
MRSRPTKIVGLLFAVVVILAVWILFAPTKLGGSTTYSITDGISMQPLLYKNDLALVRSQSSYHVGEVVLYESQVLHKPVLHRIILIQNGNYFFKGDNNHFVDPGYATRSELIGALWIHIPNAGAVLGWFGKPAHAGLLAGFVAALIVLTSAKTRKSRRRRHRGSADRTRRSSAVIYRKTAMPKSGSVNSERRSESNSARSPTSERRSGIAMTPREAAARRPPSYLDGPTPTLAALGVLSSLTLLLVIVGFALPLHRVVPLAAAYKQAGTFSYSGAVKTPTPVYPSGLVATGDPIYPSLVESVGLRFGYQFTSPLPHHITGTIEFRVLLLSQSDTWQQLSTLKAATGFSGDRATISSSLPLNGLYKLINLVSAQTGIPATSYSADIEPMVHVIGTVNGTSINQTFAPVLPFTVTETEISLVATVAPAIPGATYVAPTATSALAATVHPVVTGSVPHVVPNKLSLAKYQIPIPALRLLGIILGALAVITAAAHDILRRRRTARSRDDLIARKLHSVIVPVASLARPEGPPPIEIPDFANLAALAQYLERPILCEMGNADSRTYAVDDDDRRYISRSSPDGAGSPPSAATSERRDAGQAPAKSHRRHRVAASTVVRVGGGLVALAIAATVATSFTASTHVPASSVGRITIPGAVSQAIPPGCSSLTLTLESLVIGSGTFSNDISHALILGSANKDTITDYGEDNCIVGGGGKDVVRGTSSDICIIGPTGGAIYTTCATAP